MGVSQDVQGKAGTFEKSSQDCIDDGISRPRVICSLRGSRATEFTTTLQLSMVFADSLSIEIPAIQSRLPLQEQCTHISGSPVS